jgi:hypothetical protein
MATITPTITRVGENVVQIEYALSTGNLDGAPFRSKHFGDYSDRNVAVYGDLTGTVVVQGSPDGATWVGLTDASTTAISFAAASGVETINENPPYTRPLMTGTATACRVVFTLRRDRGGKAV